MLVSIEPSVRQFIAQNFMYREGMQSLADDQSLLEHGLVDSTGVLELVFFLEKSFAIKVGEEEVIPENLDSVQKIANYVRRKLGPSSQAAVA
jgi:acyl carrier protein